MRFQKIASIKEVGMDAKRKISIGDLTILLVNIDGTFHAIDNKCPHMGGSLYEGEIEGGKIVCPRHKTTFDVTTGKVVDPGKLAFFKVHPGPVRVYPVKIEGDDILIGIDS